MEKFAARARLFSFSALFGRRQRMLLPQPDSAYEQVSFEKAALAKDKHFDAQGVSYDKDKVSLPVLSIGQLVRVQDKKTGQWQALATVIEARPDGLSYIVNAGGREQLRSRHMLRPESVFQTESERDGPQAESERDGPKVGVIPLPTTVLRRSQRLLDKNSEGNRLIPAQKCAEARQNEGKLNEFRRLQKLHWDSMPTQQGISKSVSEDQTINQHSDGFSIVNLQWASFASGATVIIAVAIVGVLVTLCCYFRARNDRRRRKRHHQLIETISGRVLPRRKLPGRADPMPSESESALEVPPALSGSGWYRTPNGGWSGAPVSPPAIPQHALPAILAAAGGQVHCVQQLPFPGFPPVNYQPAGLSSGGMPGCRTPGSVTYQARPAISCDRDRFTEIRDEPQPQQQPRQASSQSSVAESLPFPRRERSTSRQSRGRRVSFSESEGVTDSTQIGTRPSRQRPRQRQQLSGPKSSCRDFKTGV